MHTRRGYALAELIIASSLAILAVGIILSLIFMANRMWKSGAKQAVIQREAHLITERLSRGIRRAYRVTVSENGDRIEAMSDPALTPFDFNDDITSAFYLNATGSTTPEDEALYRLSYDADTDVPNNEVVLTSRLVKDELLPLFQKGDDLVEISFSIKDDYADDGLQSIDISSGITLRGR